MDEFQPSSVFQNPYLNREEDCNEDVLRFLELSPPHHENAGSDLLDADVSMQSFSTWDFIESHNTETEASVDGRAHLDCRECAVLREVVHSNGVKNMRLSIHGSVGRFYHAMLDVSYIDEQGCSSSIEQSFIDLSEQSFDWVKQFLTDYSLLRLRDDFTVAYDSASDFFDTLCVKMGDGVLHFPSDAELCRFRPSTIVNCARRSSKTGIAAQRERTGNLHIRDLANYFHLPIAKASKELGICSTALKKVCRRHGMQRWPHRKITSIDRRVSKLLREYRDGDEEEALIAQTEIERLRAQKSRLLAGLPPL